MVLLTADTIALENLNNDNALKRLSFLYEDKRANLLPETMKDA